MIRQGRVAGRRDVVLHLVTPSTPVVQPSTVGLIVGRSVGGSVTRHRVSRRLRAQLAQQIDRLPAGAALVVRAKSSAATADSAALGQQLESGLRRLIGPAALPRAGR